MRLLFARTARLKPGDAAPDFDLADQKGERHTLGRYRGRWLVLYFYPRDDTPGCTREACRFRDASEVLDRLGGAVVGVSLDSLKSHQKFAAKHRLGFPLLSDPEGSAARAYGTLLKLGPLCVSRRHTFVIDPAGRIAKVYRAVDPASHSDQLIHDLSGLVAGWKPAP